MGISLVRSTVIDSLPLSTFQKHIKAQDDVRLLRYRGALSAFLAAELAAEGIMAGGGDFYAVRPLEAMGIDAERGVLRLSFVHYTDRSETDKLIEALDKVI